MRIQNTLFIAVMFGALSSQATTLDFFIQDVYGSPMSESFGGGSPLTCTAPVCGVLDYDTVPGSTVTSTLPLNFNIFSDPGMTVLEDTLAIKPYSTSGFFGFQYTFTSSRNGNLLTPLSNATSIVATGAPQVATDITFSDGAVDEIRFQSAVAPEPSYSVLMAVLLALGLATFYRRMRARHVLGTPAIDTEGGWGLPPLMA